MLGASRSNRHARLINVDAYFIGSPLPPSGQVVRTHELELGSEVGRGAMGVVYAARWEGKDVAVKTLINSSAAQLAATEQAALSPLRLDQLSAQLTH